MTKSLGLHRWPDNDCEGHCDVVIQKQNSADTQDRINTEDTKTVSRRNPKESDYWRIFKKQGSFLHTHIQPCERKDRLSFAEKLQDDF
jgi:hypothetical protein